MISENPYKIPSLESQIQQCNFQVVNCTTPANFFHVLRRQIYREFRKPLIVMSPKKLLKHKLCRSNIEEFDEGTSFKRLLPETEKNLVSDNNIKRVIFCSGQVYYDLYETRQARNIDNIAIIRLEQLAPFPFDLVMNELKRIMVDGLMLNQDLRLVCNMHWEK
jgi:2-oxoglutarate dehydrogenase E1 component